MAPRRREIIVVRSLTDSDLGLFKEHRKSATSKQRAIARLDAVIAISNSTAYGLSSGICTQRLDVIMRFVKELNVGSVNVWEVPGYRLEVTPFGGIKDSGTGVKEGVQECCKAFTNVKTYSLPW